VAPQDYHTVFRMGLVSFPWSAFGHSSVLIALGLLVIRSPRLNVQNSLAGWRPLSDWGWLF
jgi:hypothetical protein